MKKMSIVLALSLFSASSAMANIVTNGSFEDLTGFSLGNATWGLSNTLSGWKKNSPDMFEIQLAKDFQTSATGFYNSFNASHDGAHYLELNANGLGDISQTLATVAGQRYRLAFAYSGRSDSGTGNDSLLDVYWGGSKINPVVIDASPTSGWHTRDYFLNATEGSTELRFVSRGPIRSASYGSYLDGITVSAVPEPATVGLLLAGLGMIGFTTRLQKPGKNRPESV